MTPLAWLLGNLRLAGLIAAVLAGASALYWFADKIGDSRELDVTRRLEKQEDRTHEAANEGRQRARACHALGPDRLWNVEHQRCDRIPDMPGPRP